MMKRAFCGRLRAALACALWLGSVVLMAQPVAAQRFVLGINDSPLTFHPWDLATGNSVNHRSFNERLVYLDKNLQPTGELATGWSFNAEGTVFTMKLRQGVTFHNGKPFTSADVKRSWEQITQGKFTGSHANLKPLATLVTELRTPDAHTVELHYAAPNPAVFEFLDLFYVIDMDQWATINSKPAGTGPYMLKEYVPGNRQVSVVYPGYWGQKPAVQELEYRVIPDPQAMVLNLESGSVDGIIFFPGREVPRLQGKGFNVFAANPDGIVVDVLFNTQWGAFKDKRARQAVNKMINRARFHRVVMSNLGEAKCLPWPKASLAYDAELEASCRMDPEGAKQLLAEAGLSNGFEVEFMTSSQQSAEQAKLAEMMQEDLKQIGIRVKVADKDTAGYTAVYRAASFQMATHNYGRGNKDPSSLFGSATVWKAKGNVQNYANAEYEQLINAAASTLDEAERKRLYRKLNEWILDDIMTASVHTLPRWFAHNKRFNNIGASVDGFMYFYPMTQN